MFYRWLLLLLDISEEHPLEPSWVVKGRRSQVTGKWGEDEDRNSAWNGFGVDEWDY
jgi:hypothetical protein